MAMTLAELCTGLPGVTLEGGSSLTVAAVTADSREAGPQVLFVAVRGTERDGHDFLKQVRTTGCRAVAVLADGPESDVALEAGCFESVIRATDTRPLPALLARRLNGCPDRRMWTAAVTGTNGKTTVSYLMKELLDRMHGPCGLLGTIRYDDGRTSVPAPLTTPGGPVFYRWLGRMVDTGCRSVAMEISSHALAQERTAGLRLDVAVMTNLGRDHLDYHRDLAEYLAAKARIRELLQREAQVGGTEPPGTLVLNAADPALAGLAGGNERLVRFSADPAVAADLRVTACHLGMTGTRLELDWQGLALQVESPLVGRFNVENLTAALAAGIALGLDPVHCADALAGVPQVPGRLERFPLPSGGLAVVDYAHTHDALAAVLGTCRELTDRRLIAVFGCGGDRDRGKRPLMGEVAARDADLAWITSDNPRSEDPQRICAEIAAGFDSVAAPRASSRRVVVDRTAAITSALAAADEGDIVVVAGKGHEDYQLIGDRRLDLDDRAVIGHWIRESGGHA